MSRGHIYNPKSHKHFINIATMLLSTERRAGAESAVPVDSASGLLSHSYSVYTPVPLQTSLEETGQIETILIGDADWRGLAQE